MDNQSNAIALIGNQLHQCALSILASRDEKAIEGKIAVIDNSLAFESQCLRSTDDPKEKTTIKETIFNLKAERREQTALLSKAAETTLRLIGPTPGALIPRPSTSGITAQPIDCTPTLPDDPIVLVPSSPDTFEVNPLSDDLSQPPPPHQPTHSSPCTPAKLTHAATFQTPMPPSHSNSSSRSSYSSFTSIAANVDPLIFDFSNIDTPTTNTAGKAVVPTKRSKPGGLSESPTKRVRSSDRISTA